MILRDPVHGLIAFDLPEESVIVRLLGTTEMQRLRRIKQLGVASLVFPGGEHTRFAHAVGTAHVMKRLIARLRDVEDHLAPHQRLVPARATEALAAALLHDVGHGPLSHLFEEALAGAPPHEEWSTRIILDPASEVSRVLSEQDRELPARVAELVLGRHELTYLARAVSGTVDVDRCDYLLRDAHATGVPHGRYDLDWLLRSFTFGPSAEDGGAAAPPLAIDGGKGIVALEAFVLARLFMFQQVYFHKAARAAEWMIGRILSRVAHLLRDGTPVTDVPRALVSMAQGKKVSLSDYLELDDHVIHCAMHAWESAGDPILADLTSRVRRRALFKTLELYEKNAQQWETALETARDIARRRGLSPESYVGLDVASDTPFRDEDDPLAVVFPHDPGKSPTGDGVTRKPGDVSFLLGRLRGETVTRARLIFAPELRDEIRSAIT